MKKKNSKKNASNFFLILEGKQEADVSGKKKKSILSFHVRKKNR